MSSMTKTQTTLFTTEPFPWNSDTDDLLTDISDTLRYDLDIHPGQWAVQLQPNQDPAEYPMIVLLFQDGDDFVLFTNYAQDMQ